VCVCVFLLGVPPCGGYRSYKNWHYYSVYDMVTVW